MDSSDRHIVLFIPSLTYGGAEQVAVILANAFSRSGIKTSLITATSGDDISDQLDDSVKHASLDQSRVLTSIPYFSQYLRKTQPDAVLSFMTHTNVAAILANEMAYQPAKIVVSEHTTISNRECGRKDQLILSAAARLYPRANRVVAVSNGIASELQDDLGLKEELIQTIHNPVRRPDESDLQSPPNPWFEDSGPVLLAVGRHEPQKDFSTLLHAVAKFKSDRVNTKLVLLSEGSETPNLKKLAANLGIEQSVSFEGYVSDPYPYFSAADLFVLSSRWEGFGNVIVEAMMVGTPVVATDCPVGPAEVLSDGEFGKLAPVGDPDGLAHAIRNELRNPTDTTKLRERSKEFDPDRIAAIYKRVMF
ncbi:glycosyltransferase [Halorhabdus utahensis]|nr:glycosyltransferase [Halorhabdus utahensis]